MNDFNKNHPEKGSDEVFLGYFDNEFDHSNGYPLKSNYENLPFKTKRKGLYFFDHKGNPLSLIYPRIFPVFVKIWELESSKKE